jgi:hypothetical protein
MSDILQDQDRLNLRAQIARIDRAQAEIQKLFAETGKLFAERDKLSAEARKFSRERSIRTLLAITGLIGGLITVAQLIVRLRGRLECSPIGASLARHSCQSPRRCAPAVDTARPAP